MTIDEGVRIARYGAKVQLSPEAKKRQNDAFGLILQASAEGIPVYGFKPRLGLGPRGVPCSRATHCRPENSAYITGRLNGFFREGPRLGIGPEVAEEEIVRAMMAVRANTMVYESASPRAQPAAGRHAQQPGRAGDPVARLPWVRPTSNRSRRCWGPWAGRGTPTHLGVRMSARAALAAAGLKPLQPMEAIYTSS